MSYKSQIQPVLGTIDDGCQRWNFSRATIYRLIGEGKIVAIKVGKCRRIDIAASDANLLGRAA
jgi:excisionase family DNA binding protein